MRRHTIARAGLFSFAAGAALVLGGVAEPAAASPPTAVPGLATDCDVSGGAPGGVHAPGGHDSHGMPDMPGMTMAPGEGTGAHEGHGSHATSPSAVAGPSDGTRTVVLSGFSAVNGSALVAAAVLRRRTASRRERRVAARAAAAPAHSGTERSPR
jgi:hypothetical protein